MCHITDQYNFSDKQALAKEWASLPEDVREILKNPKGRITCECGRTGTANADVDPFECVTCRVVNCSCQGYAHENAYSGVCTSCWAAIETEHYERDGAHPTENAISLPNLSAGRRLLTIEALEEKITDGAIGSIKDFLAGGSIDSRKETEDSLQAAYKELTGQYFGDYTNQGQ